MGRNGNRFSLVEMMAALVILAMALAMFASALSQAVVLRERSRHLTLATLFAQQKMEECTGTLATGTPLPSESGGTGTDLFSSYAWSCAVTRQPAPDTRLLNVRITVTWNEGRREQRVAFFTRIRNTGAES